MSALVALYAFDSFRFSTGSVERMLTALEHRGDDKVGVWTRRSIGLGHRMRWTTEESLYESLPAESRESGCVISCDARIDNRSELIAELSFRQKSNREITDSDIILAAYEKWGEDCLAKLIGDFVFAIWDPNSEKLFCGRDPLGVRHFYYYYLPGKFFALASEIKALFCLDEISCELDEKSLGDYLLFNFEDKESTFYSGIKRLPATHAIIVSENNLRIWEYWRPNPEKHIRLKNRLEYHEAFREKFLAAVTSRLRSAYPVGSFLSGGLDSSAITCVASEYLAHQGRPPLQTFSAVWPTVSQEHSRINEMSYMQSVIEKTGCKPHFVNCDDNNPWKDLSELVSSADHPVGFPNMYIHWEIFKTAKAEGVKILLDGFDGDTTVSHGYEIFEHFAKQGHFLRMFKEARLLKKNIPHRFHSIENLVLKKGIDLCVPPSLENLWYLLSRRRFKPNKSLAPGFSKRSWQMLNEEFKERYNRQKALGRDNGLSLSNGPTLIESHWRNLTSGMFSRSLEFSEIASQAFSVESRYPFFDRRLIEFCLAIPPSERIYNGWTRAVFRHAMEGILPESVRWRGTKANLGIALKLNMLKYGFEELDNVMNRDSRTIENFVNIDELKAIYKRFAENPLKAFDSDCLILVATVHLSDWIKKGCY